MDLCPPARWEARGFTARPPFLEAQYILQVACPPAQQGQCGLGPHLSTGATLHSFPVCVCTPF